MKVVTLDWMKSVNDGDPLYSTHILVLLQAIRGRYVVNGCDVVPGTGLQVIVNSGQIYYVGEFHNVSQTTLTIASNSSGHVRGDLIVWNYGTKSLTVRQGSGYAVVEGVEIPVIPRPEDDDVPLAVVVVADGATSFITDDIKDVRVNAVGNYMFDPLMVYEDMTQTPSGTLKGNAYYDNTNGYVVLTQATTSQSGQLEYEINPLSSWYVEFEYYAGGGTGADATYFYVYCESTPSNEASAAGGYIIALDEYQNQIQINYDGTIVATATPTYDIDDGQWHKVFIVFEKRRIRVWVDGVLQIDYTDTQRDLSGILMGIGARTSGSTNEHRVRYLKVSKYAGILPVYI